MTIAVLSSSILEASIWRISKPRSVRAKIDQLTENSEQNSIRSQVYVSKLFGEEPPERLAYEELVIESKLKASVLKQRQEQVKLIQPKKKDKDFDAR
jgi:hypothetical protein